MNLFLLCGLFAFTNAASILPTLPLSSGGPLSPLQIYNTVSDLYSSPLAQYLPPMKELISAAIKVNSMATTVKDSNEGINKILKDTVNKLASNLGIELPASSTNSSPSTTLQNLANLFSATTTTTPKPSIFQNIGNWLMGVTTPTVKPATNPVGK